MRVIVDTSVWSLALRRKRSDDNPETAALNRIIEEGEDIFLIGIILQEVLQGIKEPRDFRAVKEHLEAFPMFELERGDYISAAALKNHLSKRGVQASTVDALIAWTAIANDCRLFTSDRDFLHIATHSKLKLFGRS